MTWVNLDDQYPEHPKVDSLSDGAFRLNTAAICYCNRHQTDGVVTADKVARLVPRFKKAYVQELVDRLLWHDLGNGTAYELHDFLDWNSSRAEIAEAKARNVENGRKGARKRWGDR
jgi:hypothetical protein